MGAVLTAALAIAGCTSRAQTAPEGAAVEGVRIQHGESLAIEGGALEITFESVASDSRCPKGEMCVSEGDAIVVLAVRATGKPAARLELHAAARGPASIGYEGWAIRLVSLEPYPVTGRAIGAAEYVATLSVTKGGAVDLATQ
jgi:hypothetical protein